MSFLVAQSELATCIKKASSQVDFFYWRLSGNAPNSLCKFLGMDEEEFKEELRRCKILTGKNDNFSKNNF